METQCRACCARMEENTSFLKNDQFVTALSNQMSLTEIILTCTPKSEYPSNKSIMY